MEAEKFRHVRLNEETARKVETLRLRVEKATRTAKLSREQVILHLIDWALRFYATGSDPA